MMNLFWKVWGALAISISSVCMAWGAEMEKIPPHPRLMATEADFRRIRQMTETTEFGQKMKRRILRDADRIIPLPPAKYRKIGRRLLHVSRQTLRRTLFLSMAYRLTGEKKYADRAIFEARTVCAFDNWNQSHFLDTAEMTLAVSFVYDWLYDELSVEERSLFAESIRKKAFLNEKGKLSSTGRWWAKSKNNWGQVCNGGLLTGAAALREVYPDLCEKIRRISVKNIPLSMTAYQGGGFPEGPSYWEYATIYNAIAIATLQTAWGSDYGLSRLSDWGKEADYLNLMTSPIGLYFNFSDCVSHPERRELSVPSWFLAKSLNRPEVLTPWELPMLRRTLSDDPKVYRGIHLGDFFPMLLVWAPEKLGTTAQEPPRSCLLGDEVQIAVLRSGTGPSSSFLATKGGVANPNHGHLDFGSFVFDQGGVRWAADLGAEDYYKVEKEGVNLWSMAPGSGRWTVFRLSTYAHNVITLDGKQIYPKGFCPVSDVHTSGNTSYAQVDLSDAYPQVKKINRRFELGDQLKVIDEIQGAPADATLRWQMITKAQAKLEGNQVTLSGKALNGSAKKLKMTIQGVDAQWKFESISKPVRKYDSPNPGFSRLYFEAKVPQGSQVKSCVLFEPENPSEK